MNFIRYKCARCGAKVESPTDLVGQTDRCGGCGQVNRVPDKSKQSLLGSLFGTSGRNEPSDQDTDQPGHETPSHTPAPQKKAPSGPQAQCQVHGADQEEHARGFGKMPTFCSKCHRIVAVRSSDKGHKGPCPKCGKRIRFNKVRWTDEDEDELQSLIGTFAQYSYGSGQHDKKKMQWLRDRIQELSKKKSLSGATGSAVNVEFDAG
jgi:DNA-directed RNA polymerase subunit RPC12/RpoP